METAGRPALVAACAGRHPRVPGNSGIWGINVSETDTHLTHMINIALTKEFHLGRS
jgi:hypothetical protein